MKTRRPLILSATLSAVSYRPVASLLGHRPPARYTGVAPSLRPPCAVRPPRPDDGTSLCALGRLRDLLPFGRGRSGGKDEQGEGWEYYDAEEPAAAPSAPKRQAPVRTGMSDEEKAAYLEMVLGADRFDPAARAATPSDDGREAADGKKAIRQDLPWRKGGGGEEGDGRKKRGRRRGEGTDRAWSAVVGRKDDPVPARATADGGGGPEGGDVGNNADWFEIVTSPDRFKNLASVPKRAPAAEEDGRDPGSEEGPAGADPPREGGGAARATAPDVTQLASPSAAADLASRLEAAAILQEQKDAEKRRKTEIARQQEKIRRAGEAKEREERDVIRDAYLLDKETKLLRRKKEEEDRAAGQERALKEQAETRRQELIAAQDEYWTKKLEEEKKLREAKMGGEQAPPQKNSAAMESSTLWDVLDKKVSKISSPKATATEKSLLKEVPLDPEDGAEVRPAASEDDAEVLPVSEDDAEILPVSKDDTPKKTPADDESAEVTIETAPIQASQESGGGFVAALSEKRQEIEKWKDAQLNQLRSLNSPLPSLPAESQNTAVPKKPPARATAVPKKIVPLATTRKTAPFEEAARRRQEEQDSRMEQVKAEQRRMLENLKTDPGVPMRVPPPASGSAAPRDGGGARGPAPVRQPPPARPPPTSVGSYFGAAAGDPPAARAARPAVTPPKRTGGGAAGGGGRASSFLPPGTRKRLGMDGPEKTVAPPSVPVDEGDGDDDGFMTDRTGTIASRKQMAEKNGDETVARGGRVRQRVPLIDPRGADAAPRRRAGDDDEESLSEAEKKKRRSKSFGIDIDKF